MSSRYPIAAKPTKARKIQYRSRLESKYGVLFERLQWEFQYEPFDLPGWSPDFLLTGGEYGVLIEVKPSYLVDQRLFDKLTKATENLPFHVVILDENPFRKPDKFYESYVLFGLGAEYLARGEIGFFEEKGYSHTDFHPMLMKSVNDFSSLDYNHDGMMGVMISHQDRKQFLDRNHDHVSIETLQFMWRECGNETMFLKPKSSDE
jgi:hypothetical protein